MSEWGKFWIRIKIKYRFIKKNYPVSLIYSQYPYLPKLGDMGDDITGKKFGWWEAFGEKKFFLIARKIFF